MNKNRLQKADNRRQIEQPNDLMGQRLIEAERFE